MIILNFKPGDRIGIEVNRGDKKEIITCRVEKMLPGGIVAGLPIERAKHSLFKVDETVTVTWRSRESLYGIEARVMADQKKLIYMVDLRFINEPQKIQRRNFYRLETLIPVKFILAQQHGQIGIEINEYEGLIKDISGSGIRLLTRIKLSLGDIVLIKIKLGKYGTVGVKGKIVRCFDESEKQNYETGVEFEDIDTQTQDKICMYIFDQLRVLRKKGMV